MKKLFLVLIAGFFFNVALQAQEATTPAEPKVEAKPACQQKHADASKPACNHSAEQKASCKGEAKSGEKSQAMADGKPACKTEGKSCKGDKATCKTEGKSCKGEAKAECKTTQAEGKTCCKEGKKSKKSKKSEKA